MSGESDDAADSSPGYSPRNPPRSSRLAAAAASMNISKSNSGTPNPKSKATHVIDRTPEYDDFIAKLRAYHKQRGTPFEPEPWVGSAHLDLLKVFKHVVAAGGYDHVSATTLEWRKLATELGLDVTDRSAAGVAYALKSAFLKYLAAWEILTIYNKEPPPPQIMEYESAKGGGLLTRTLENYTPKKAIPAVARAPSVAASASENDEPPVRKETPRSGGTSRNLRVAPPQRVPFQPDTGSTRQTRHAATPSQPPSAPHSVHNTPSGHHPRPPLQHQAHSHPAVPHPQQPHQQHMQSQMRGPSINFTPQDPDTTSTLVLNFEPRMDMGPLQMRPVETPANNPLEFERRRRHDRLRAAGIIPGQMPIRPPPGTTAFEGPNIYMRCLNSLRSGIPAEQTYALHHLVKISYERGDKFKFETFAGLAEGLVEKALEIGNVFYNVKWTVEYSGFPDESNPFELDGLSGTPDILDRIAQLQPKEVLDNIQPADVTDNMVQIIEAVLTIRNMVTLQENAVQMADFFLLRDLICIVLHLPNTDSVVELKHMALDIAEQVAPYIVLDSEDALYRTLLAQLHSADRGIILTALRTIARLSMNLPDTNRLLNVPPQVLQNVMDWMLLNDDELIDACLDFLYTYTALIDNVDTLLKAINPGHLVNHLVRLLSHGARKVQKELILEPERKVPSSEVVLPIPDELRQQLILLDEPDRCFSWLKCLFEEDTDSAITQITIWQAYQAAFHGPLQQMSKTMIGAAEFIRNVSHVYQNAGAQIVKGPGEQSKFIIKGIRPRPRPIGQDGRDYLPCLWRVPVVNHSNNGAHRIVKCSQHFASAEKLYDHILTKHLGENRDANGKFTAKERELYCAWDNCSRYPRKERTQLFTFVNHVKTHCTATQQKTTVYGSGGESSGSRRAKRTFIAQPAKTISLSFEETVAVREERTGHPQAAGIPLSAALVLRNVARNVSRAETGASDDYSFGDKEGGGGTVELLFRPVTARLGEIMMENRLLTPYIVQVLDITRDNY